jgi:cellulose synthase/poly-beta-1,6-N-acetylglucosamine synthase-like glycosyltransferase
MVTLCAATLAAREPIPVAPQKNSRVAFTTAIVPSKEPFELVKKTLEAMVKVTHDGPIDVWLLDEGNLPEIKAACKRMGVKHFSRKDIEKYNQPEGRFKARTKHGNHNAWLDQHGHNYDYVLSLDSDHVPQPNFGKRMLGYFRDPDVAFVVGPQVYGNFDNPVTKGAESQAYIFQAAIQRAGNAYHSAMFVGTNHAYRVKAWDTIGGFQDSITEDMLTSLKVHSTRNPETGKFWKSVYTPDVVAVGEGPSSWTDFFSQQLRWARGSNEILFRNFFRMLPRLPWRARLHYSMIITYYPTVAISWVVGIMVSMVYLVLGQSGISISGKVWLALYIDVLAVQVLLYGWLRRYNVSPHEEQGTVGFPGMFFSMVSAPIYYTAFVATVLRRKTSFVVTPKGDSASPDTWQTFKKNLSWAGLVVAFLIYSLITGHNYPGVKLWSFLTIAVCMAPVAMWQFSIWRETRDKFVRFMTAQHRVLPHIQRKLFSVQEESQA